MTSAIGINATRRDATNLGLLHLLDENNAFTRMCAASFQTDARIAEGSLRQSTTAMCGSRVNLMIAGRYRHFFNAKEDESMDSNVRRMGRFQGMPFALLLALCCLLRSGTPLMGQTTSGNAARRPPAKFDKAALERSVAERLKEHGNGIEASVWLGGPDGNAWLTTTAAAIRPTASAIKAFYLVELFDRFKGRLDDELVEAKAILKDDRHPAISHFSAETRAEIRSELNGATVRRIGEVMIGKVKASNAVYNAAANVTTAVLGGPQALTEAIHRRDPAFKSVAVRRYMLRDRKMPGDNEATAAAFAALHQKLASAKLQGIDAATMKAVREVLRSNEASKLGARFGKGGSLDTDPLTQVRAGWWDTKNGVVVYVVMAAQSTPGNQTRKAAADGLRKTADRLANILTTAGRDAMEP
jgi:hypothetical protein